MTISMINQTMFILHLKQPMKLKQKSKGKKPAHKKPRYIDSGNKSDKNDNGSDSDNISPSHLIEKTKLFDMDASDRDSGLNKIIRPSSKDKIQLIPNIRPMHQKPQKRPETKGEI
jgi:hypothetical protein